jgi:hypothetical protein
MLIQFSREEAQDDIAPFGDFGFRASDRDPVYSEGAGAIANADRARCCLQ